MTDSARKTPPILTQLAVLGGLAAFAVFQRSQLTPFVNFSALGAFAVVTGSVLRARPILAMGLVLAVRAVTDLIDWSHTGWNIFNSGETLADSLWFWVYLPYLLMALLGRRINRSSYWQPIAGGLAAGSLFFVLSNLGIAIGSESRGFVQVYVDAIPFARGTFFGDVLFTPVFSLITVRTLQKDPLVSASAEAA